MKKQLKKAVVCLGISSLLPVAAFSAWADTVPATTIPAQHAVAKPVPKAAIVVPVHPAAPAVVAAKPKLNTQQQKAQILKLAQSLKGTRYLQGGSTPKGFDSSGYVNYLFTKNGVNIPRSTNSLFQKGKVVAKNALIAGDLVFFNTNRGKGVTDVGIYLGNNTFISVTTKRGVAITNLKDKYWASKFVGAKRIL
ncbi:cell wall-associated NlpC family hydrolase [Aneurinibacillus soli]|uniref:Murein DD-endopeptidase MepS/Murein LD-carboxypeptidase n=2 Tax=Aneurinibacillus soli TaxID=1500254 RepID=A0A0U5BEA0_9BACL|nr:C40 family peptidase [Aneurinibacillus soli]PYE62244.1 cell wall-associated NlpC family hydrolase [Aneurinibacillus soli]BAU28567.1 Murein DD-endopeptidase MepS/Murein LD-carboxypeptidase precursor [Aneurinibacillus soli]